MPVSELDAPENSLALTAEELAFAQATPIKTLTDAVATPVQQLRSGAVANQGPIGVDRTSGVIRGMVVAEAGNFKSKGRGAFDQNSLKTIVKLMGAQPEGVPSRAQHPSIVDDGLLKILGRLKNPRMGAVNRGGETVPAVRCDLYFNPSAMVEPVGGGRALADYLMHVAETDPGLLGSSLVLTADQTDQRDSRGKLKLGGDGMPLPPLWTPTSVLACDIVQSGEAVTSLLSVPAAPAALPQATPKRPTTAAEARAEVDRQFAEMCAASRGSPAVVRRQHWRDPAADARDFLADRVRRNFYTLKGNRFGHVLDEAARVLSTEGGLAEIDSVNAQLDLCDQFFAQQKAGLCF
jgi:hypothetical protein